MEITEKTLEKAYKKLKSSVYFDKTQCILRNDIVEFENSYNTQEDLDNYLGEIYEMLLDDHEFLELKNDILKSISIIAFPKKIRNNNSDIIMNFVPKENSIEEIQYFIDMKVEGHILGVLWLMLIGYKIDSDMYEHSYGNRIRKNLISELSENPTYSPYLFEPYFEQYESWRDTALSEAAKHMTLNQDVVVITMDFRRYYYSIDADNDFFDKLYDDADIDNNSTYTDEDRLLLKRLNDFVCAVVQTYSELFDDEFGGKHILPIGFLPSNVIANWNLKNFDKAIIDGWNPIYYGRYVDDVLIVDKVEHNGSIYKRAKNHEITKNDIIEFFLKGCSRWNGFNAFKCAEENDFSLIQVDTVETKSAKEKALEKGVNKEDVKKINVFKINPRYNAITGNKSKIIVHNDKVKIFYFKSGESDALLTCFKENIAKNKSEFRFLPEDDAIFQRDDYDEIYELKSSDTINKLRGIDGIAIDKFELSKFLGKYLRIGGMIEDKIESRFEKDILKIFDLRTIIENYTTWEKIIETFVINERFDAVEKFITRIIDAIETVKYDKSDDLSSDIKDTLYRYLHSVICRTFALAWKDELKNIQTTIYQKGQFANSLKFIYYHAKNLKGSFEKDFTDVITAYCRTCMIDKYVMPININMLSIEDIKNHQINLTRFKEVLPISKKEWTSNYKYYPYMVNMYDFCMISCVEELQKNKSFSEKEDINQQSINRYIKSNYLVEENNALWSDINKLVSVREINDIKNAYAVTVGNGNKSKLRIAIANVKLNHENFKMLVKDTPNRTYARYKDLSYLVNQAIEQKADMLVMPEAFVPFEWLSTLARTCARNNLAVITGIEHIKFSNDSDKNNIFNLTAVILPYKEKDYRCSHISFHLKTHYAPDEKEEINGYNLTEVTGNQYELYKWNNCYFPVYCCYELTSITDRSIFQSYADLLIAVEWNRDVNYYSNILESLSRDIHCYCVQVNTSDYGDSRITKPSKTENKDIIRTKGGINNTILIEDIDIAALREFQLKNYTLQKKDSRFKMTPPDFDMNIAMKKIKGDDLFE